VKKLDKMDLVFGLISIAAQPRDKPIKIEFSGAFNFRGGFSPVKRI
jgi:hypothetical protein